MPRTSIPGTLWQGQRHLLLLSSRSPAVTPERLDGPRDVTHASRSLVDLRHVLPRINVSAVAFDDDGAVTRLRQLATPRLCRVVTIELPRLYDGATRLGELIAKESVE
jgi:hypothetical protein